MSAQASNAKRLFLEALQNHGPDQWAQFLDKACGTDDALRQRVEALLEAHGESNRMLDRSGLVATIALSPISERPGSVIGPFKLREKIGEGGFGVVYVAQQTEPVRRKVALKIIKPGMDTREVIARFEAERQALALMDHPNIAQVYDGGTTPDGRPFFVMELVRGIPITEYCDRCNLTTRERLELFVQVCQAVQHAHQKGIIHRDLKPSNVMIAMRDGKPAPKIIDFGVAKAINQRLTERTLMTGYAQMLGTPLYMSPEQAELSPLEVDTRSDIYSLGVLLYELLTSTTPFGKERLSTASFDELRRIIREEEPPRPSHRLSTLQVDAQLTVAEHRRTDPKKLHQTVRGDLDWIVMKCLEKDRTRRYETANALARDIERYLAEEPIEARPPSAWYQFRKFVRRNKGPVLAVTLVATTLIAATLVSMRLAIRARKAEDLATARLKGEQQAHMQAVSEAAKAQSIAGLLQQMLGSASPDQARGKDYTVRRMLDEFSASLDGQLADQPEVAASIHNVMGMAYWRLDRAKGLRHLKLTLDLRRGIYSSDDPRVADAMLDYAWASGNGDKGSAAEAIRLVRQAITIYRQHEQDRSLLHALRRLIRFHEFLDQTEDAQLAYEQAQEVYARVQQLGDADMACILHDMAELQRRHHELDEAERLARQSVELHVRSDGAEGLETGYGRLILAQALNAQGKYEEAALSLRQAIPILGKNLGPDHDTTRMAYQALENALKAQGDTEGLAALQAEQLSRNVEQVRGNTGDADVWIALGRLCIDIKRPQEAAMCLERAAALGPHNPDLQYKLALLVEDLGRSAQQAGQLADAEAHARQAVERLATLTQSAETTPSERVAFGHALCFWAELLLTIRREPEAEQVVRQALGAFEALTKDYPDKPFYRQETEYTHRLLGDVFSAMARYEDAVQSYRAAIDIDYQLATEAPQNNDYRQRINHDVGLLARALSQIGRSDKAAQQALYQKLTSDEVIATYRFSLDAELAQQLIREGRYQEAFGQFRESIAAAKDRAYRKNQLAWLKNQLAWLLVTCPDTSLRDPAQAVALAKDAVAAAPNAAYIWNTLGATHYYAGNFNEAVAAINRSQELAEGSSYPSAADWFILAMAHWRLGHKDDARQWFDRAVEWMDQNDPSEAKFYRSGFKPGSPGTGPQPRTRFSNGLYYLCVEADALIHSDAASVEAPKPRKK